MKKKFRSKNSFKRTNKLNKLLIPILIILALIVLCLLFFKFKSTGNAIVVGNVYVSDSCLGVRDYGLSEERLATCYQKVKNKDITSFSEAEEENCVDYVCGVYKLTQDSRVSAKDKTLANRNCLNTRIKNLNSYCSDWCYSGITADELGEENCDKTTTANPNLKSAKVCREAIEVSEKVNINVVEKCAKAFEASTIFSRLNTFARAESAGCGDYVCALYWLSTHNYKGTDSANIYHDSCAKSIGRNGAGFLSIIGKTRCESFKPNDKELPQAKDYGEENRMTLSTYYPLLDDGKGGWMYRLENYNTRGSWIFSDQFSNDKRFTETFQGFEYNSVSSQTDTAIYQPVIFNVRNFLNIHYNNIGTVNIELVNSTGGSSLRLTTICENEKKGSTAILMMNQNRVTKVLYNSNVGQSNSACNFASLGFNRDDSISITPKVGSVDVVITDPIKPSTTKTVTVNNPSVKEDLYYLKFTIIPTKDENLKVNVWGLNTDELE